MPFYYLLTLFLLNDLSYDTRTVIQGWADSMCLYQDGIFNAVDIGNQFFRRDQGWVNTKFDAIRRTTRNPQVLNTETSNMALGNSLG